MRRRTINGHSGHCTSRNALVCRKHFVPTTVAATVFLTWKMVGSPVSLKLYGEKQRMLCNDRYITGTRLDYRPFQYGKDKHLSANEDTAYSFGENGH